MAMLVHLSLKDDDGAMVHGGSDVQGRESSIKLRGLTHNPNTPTDGATGRLTSTRQYSLFPFDKEVDSSSPYLYRTIATGQTLQGAELKFYYINDTGQEVEYFNTLLEGMKVVSVTPIVYDTRTVTGTGYLESVQLRHERITWCIVDSNIQYADAWNERITA